MNIIETKVLKRAVVGIGAFLLLATRGYGGWEYQAPPMENDYAGLYNGKVEFADFDNDGDLDFVATGKQGYLDRFVLYRNDGNYTFTRMAEPLGATVGLYESMQDIGDYDGDGDLDICVIGIGDNTSDGYCAVYRNDGNFNLVRAADFGMTDDLLLKSGCVKWGDYDNDGDLDLAVIGQDVESDPRFIICKNMGNDSWLAVAEPMNYRNGAGAVVRNGLVNGWLTWADFNNDGTLEIAAIGRDSLGNNRCLVMKNAGTDTFTIIAEPLNVSGDTRGIINGEICSGDFNADGLIDIVVAGQDNQNIPRAIVLMNNGGFNFTNASEPMSGNGGGVTYGSVRAGDDDNDGDLDLLMLGMDDSGRRLLVFHNDGSGNFSLAAEPFGSGEGLYHGNAVWGDFDADGDLDFAALGASTNVNSNWTSCSLDVYANDNGYPANIRPPATAVQALAGQSFPFDTPIVFSWSSVTGDATPAALISYNIRIGSTPGGADIRGADTNSSHAVTGERAGNIGSRTSYILSDTLVPGTYYWSVQAIDAGMMKSVWAIEDYFIIADPDTSPVFIITPDSFYHQTPMIFANGSGTVSLTSSRPIDTATLNCISVKEQVSGTLTPVTVNMVFEPAQNKIIISYPFKSGYEYLFQVGANLKTTAGDTLGADTEFCFRVFLPDSGGTVTFLDGDISLTFGNEGMWVTPTVTKSAATDTVIIEGVGLFAGDAVFELDVYDTFGNPLNQTLQNPVSVVFRLDSLSGAERIGYYNEVTDSWIIVSTADNVDTINNTITVMLTHFSTYAVFSVYTLSAISQGQVAFRSLNNPHTSFPAVFRCQSPEAGNYTVEIIDLRSRPVWSTSGTIAANTQTDINWNGQTRSGRTCANGVYYALLRVNGSAPSVWKIMVVR